MVSSLPEQFPASTSWESKIQRDKNWVETTFNTQVSKEGHDNNHEEYQEKKEGRRKGVWLYKINVCLRNLSFKS